jgi:hypothetical protein
MLVALLASAVLAQAVPACTGSQLTGSFAEIPGSPGAGQISYLLRLTNVSAQTCFVTGLPRLQLLGRRGKALPTHVIAEQPGALTAVRVELRHGGSTTATARFSPDVPGPGERTIGRCELPAYRLRVRPNGGGSVLVPIRQPTSVCEHGRLKMTAFSVAK